MPLPVQLALAGDVLFEPPHEHHLLQRLCAVVQLPVPLALLEISSLNRLMGIASKIVGRDLSNESQEEALVRWKEWQSASSALGLHPHHLAVALSAKSKALMVYMHMAARYGSGSFKFEVRPISVGCCTTGIKSLAWAAHCAFVCQPVCMP